MVAVDPLIFYQLGLNITSNSPFLSCLTLERRFRSAFGTTPLMCSRIWSLLTSLPCGAKPVHLLWALLFLKCYSSECIAIALTGVDNKTYRKWSWCFIEKIGDLEIVSTKNAVCRMAVMFYRLIVVSCFVD